MMERLRRLLKRIKPTIKTPKLDPDKKKKSILFYRDFRGFTGGHLKVWHYYNHAKQSDKYQPLISFSPETIWHATNPWSTTRQEALNTWDTKQADVLFLAGMDWNILNEAQRRSPSKPIINLIQHVRHANPEEPLYPFLSHRAVRICVSEQVTQALQATRKVNGPLFTIPNGIDLTELPLCNPWESRDIDILIAGVKQPALAMEIYKLLDTFKHNIKVLTHPIPRPDFLNLLNAAKVTLFLPHETEGFYLPALEGFALGTLVVCPDCIGNRTFCLTNKNCLQPSYNVESLLHTTQYALQLPPQERFDFLQSGWQIAQQHSLSEERRLFLEILNYIERIW